MSRPEPMHWQAPTPTLGERIATAAARASYSVPLAVALVLAFRFLRALVALDAEPQVFFSADAIIFAAVFTALVWGMLFSLFLIGTSRAWSDRLFTVSGFLATFSGLAVLAIFFIQLGGDVADWLFYTPLLVAQNNEKIGEQLERRKALNVAKIAELESTRDRRIRQAVGDAEKQRLHTLYAAIIAQERTDQESKLAEDRIIIERSMRSASRPASLFWYFLTNSASSEPQNAGIGPALWGSIWLGLITVIFAVPVGVGAALYLEEYRSEGWLARVIQININNLAGVPSVVYGILGGFVFVLMFRKIQEMGVDLAPRNLLGGGLTLGLLTLPMVIVSAQEAIRAVPSSLRQGAYALGATKWQVMWTIVLPMARPGILTGTILSLSRAIGEAAPLVLFGALVFVDQNPTPFSRFTALPMQIFGWCDRPPMADPTGAQESIEMWKYNAAVASAVLLIVLLGMNAVAITLRNRAQKKMRY